MKKQTLLLLAGGMLAFASCNNSAPAGGGMSQEQVDSAVNVRVEEMRMQLTAQNDSLINVMAQFKADSMIAAMKSGAPAPQKVVVKTKPIVPTAKSSTTNHTTTTTNTTPTPLGKKSQAQEQGEPMGKKNQTQQTEGVPMGKKRNNQ